jgi:hypothetical protein
MGADNPNMAKLFSIIAEISNTSHTTRIQGQTKKTASSRSILVGEGLTYGILADLGRLELHKLSIEDYEGVLEIAINTRF